MHEGSAPLLPAILFGFVIRTISLNWGGKFLSGGLRVCLALLREFLLKGPLTLDRLTTLEGVENYST